jgi:hypothetical protein
MISLVKKENPNTWKTMNLDQHAQDYHSLLELFRKKQTDIESGNQTHNKV